MGVVASYCYQDIMEHVDGIAGRMGANPTPKFVLQLCNQALREIAEEALPLKKTWTGSATAGDSSIVAVNTTDKVYAFSRPLDLIRIIRVDYTDNTYPYTLECWHHDALDAVVPGWQSSSNATGVPTRYCADADVIEIDIPMAIGNVAKFSVQGYAHLPAMAVNETVATTPLRYLPATWQLALAWYVLSELPIDLENKNAMVVQSRYQQKWDQARAKIVESLFGVDLSWEIGR